MKQENTIVTAVKSISLGMILATVLLTTVITGRTMISRTMVIKSMASEPVANTLDESIKNLYDDYGIVVHKNFRDYPFSKAGYEINYAINVDVARDMLNTAHEELSRYSDEVIENIPKDWYLVGKVKDKNEEVFNIVNAWVVNRFNKNLALVLAINSYETARSDFKQTINHELFHTIYFTQWTEDDISNFENIKEDCHALSNYACTSTSENVAESWGFMMAGTKETETTTYLLENYSQYLRASE